MAVVQISRIQQRRGKKNSATGFPQLASGEIGWAIDTQELFIGNGAVSEGAPYVGNTQILTEHINIIDFAEAYTYQRRENPVIQTGPTFNTPIQRTLQERFDERVDIRSFIELIKIDANGAIAPSDVTDDIQRALDQLYLNDSTKNGPNTRVVLHFGPGEYFISNELRIPSYAYISGAGIDSTIIHMTGSEATGSMLRTVDSNSSPGTYTPFASMTYSLRPKFIIIENLTLQTDLEEPILLLDNADTVTFNHVKFAGIYNNFKTQPIGTDPADTNVHTGVYSRSTSGIHRPENVTFNSCIFTRTGFGFFSESDHNNITFLNCQFYELFDAIHVGGEVYGAVNSKIEGCTFDQITRYGLWVKKGYGNTSVDNKYLLVGNNAEGYSNATYSIIRFNTPNNQSTGDYFERNSRLKDQSLFGSRPFMPNIQTAGLVIDSTNFVRPLETTPSNPVEFLRLPLYNSATYFIDYVLNKNTVGSAVRTGTIHVTVDYLGIKWHLKDDYTYTGSPSVENIEFSAELSDKDEDGTRETLLINLFNPVGNGVGTVNYSYRMLTR